MSKVAEMLASLSHPGISGIHRLEDVDGTRFLVLELVEGQTLEDRIRRGPVPVEEGSARAPDRRRPGGGAGRCRPPGSQAGECQGHARRPREGARLRAREGARAGRRQRRSLALTHLEPGGEAGGILGTAAYMSPEQAKGQPVDKRSDLFALGCVLFELLVRIPASSARSRK